MRPKGQDDNQMAVALLEDREDRIHKAYTGCAREPRLPVTLSYNVNCSGFDHWSVLMQVPHSQKVYTEAQFRK